MNKKIIFTILGILLLASVTAIVTLENGNKLIGEEELRTKTNQEIQTYMQNNLVMTRYKILQDKIRVTYNITYLEPTHSDYTYNDSNNVTQIIDNAYRSFKQEQHFFIPLSLWNKCINKITKQNCRDFLVDRETPYYIIENVSYELDDQTYYEITNTTIKSTYLQAQEEQIKQFNRAKEFRDKAINNELEELINLL